MATPAPNSMAALAATPFGSEHPTGGSCLDDPNFATICSFIEKFGEIVRIGHVPFDELQQMLENTNDVPLPLVQLHITLLRRVFKAVTPDKWERSLAKFGHMYCSQDAWEVERFGYKKAKIQTKLRLLKNLLEAQFDFNVKFKSEVNKLQAADLRLQPLGRDTEGQVYWYQVDEDANLRVYREDIDDETWEIVASSKDELADLISRLQRGEVKKPEPEEAIIVPEEDSNGKDIEPKEIILDTGKVEDDESNVEESEESEDESDEPDKDVKPEVQTVAPIYLRQNSSGNQLECKTEKMEVDVKVSTSESSISTDTTIENSNKPPIGLKFVFGVKSKPKLHPVVTKQELTELESENSTKPPHMPTINGVINTLDDKNSLSCVETPTSSHISHVEETKTVDHPQPTEKKGTVKKSSKERKEVEGKKEKDQLIQNTDSTLSEKVSVHHNSQISISISSIKEESKEVQKPCTDDVPKELITEKSTHLSMNARSAAETQDFSRVTTEKNLRTKAENQDEGNPSNAKGAKIPVSVNPVIVEKQNQSIVRKQEVRTNVKEIKNVLSVAKEPEAPSELQALKRQTPVGKELEKPKILPRSVDICEKPEVKDTLIKADYTSSSKRSEDIGGLSKAEIVRVPEKVDGVVKSKVDKSPTRFHVVESLAKPMVVDTPPAAVESEPKGPKPPAEVESGPKHPAEVESRPRRPKPPAEVDSGPRGPKLPAEVESRPRRPKPPAEVESGSKPSAVVESGPKPSAAVDNLIKPPVVECHRSNLKTVTKASVSDICAKIAVSLTEKGKEKEADASTINERTKDISNRPLSQLQQLFQDPRKSSTESNVDFPVDNRDIAQNSGKESGRIRDRKTEPKPSLDLSTDLHLDKSGDSSVNEIKAVISNLDSSVPNASINKSIDVVAKSLRIAESVDTNICSKNVAEIDKPDLPDVQSSTAKPVSLKQSTSNKVRVSAEPPKSSADEDARKSDGNNLPPVPVVEEPISKVETWVCGKIESHDDNKTKLEIIEEKVVKEKTWVCGAGEMPKDSKVADSNLVSNETVSVPVSSQDVNMSSSGKVAKATGSLGAAHMKVDIQKDQVMETDTASIDKEIPISNSPSKAQNSSLVLYSESSDDGSDNENPTQANNHMTNISLVQQPGDVDHLSKDSPDEKSGDKKNVPLANQNVESNQVLTVSSNAQNPGAEDISCTRPKEPLNPELRNINQSSNPNISDTGAQITDLKIVEAATDPERDLKSDLKSESRSESTTSKETKAEDIKVADLTPTPGTVGKEANISKVDGSDGLRKPNDDKCVVESKVDNDCILQRDSHSDGVSENLQLLSDQESMLGKRKAEEDVQSSPKAPRLDIQEKQDETPAVQQQPFNPIVGETIEEDVMTITGEGSGALNEGSNENSPAALAADIPGSHDESIESESSREAFPARGRGGRRGRGRGRGAGTGGRNNQTSSPSRSASRGLREVARLGVSLDSIEVNGDRENERPVRASRRIAQIRLKEEEERRKLEEERLAQLKAAQIQKKAKQAEKEKNKSDDPASQNLSVIKGKKGRARKSLKDQLNQSVTDYVPSGSESEDNSDDEGESDEFSLEKGGKRKHKRRKNGKAKKGGNPWATSSEEEEEEAVEEEEEYHYEEEEEELVFKSDHEFSPESDLGEDDGIGPSRHARTAKQDKGDLFEEGNCCKCGKGDHPEWILLCDKCDKGWHASCLRPQLWVIPEGEWFCPPCQHNMLIENLSKNLVEYEGLLKKRENEILRKQRLAYVGISLDNVLPEKEKPEKIEVEPEERHSHHERKKQRRRILSDEEEELSDFINDRSDDDLSRSRSNSSDDSDDEPVYRLRARRSKKAFNFKEYDDMINSALRVDDDEEAEPLDEEKEEQAEVEANGDEKLNGEEPEVHSGKNEAYLKHLEEQAHEEDETDEELLDEKERLRRRELKKGSHRKTRRRINDLDAYSEEDSDDDFNASEAEDDEEEEVGDDGESEWSGDKMESDSDDSIAKRARRKERHGRLGRREKYSKKGLVRRSTRIRKSRISYDDSDEDEEEEDQNDKWQSEEETEESESNSESDDATWGKRKKRFTAKPKMPNFFTAASSSAKGKGGVKRKKRKTDDDDVDRAWNSARGKKQKDEPVERRTRGRKINFKDILDSGESDDEGNVRPKRRPLSDSDDSRSPSCSRKLAEEIRAENERQEKEYQASQAKKTDDATKPDEALKTIPPPVLETPIVAKLLLETALSSGSQSPKVVPSPVNQLPVTATVSPAVSPIMSSPISIPPISSPLSTATNPSPLTLPAVLPLNVSPVPLPLPTPVCSLPSGIVGMQQSALPLSSISPLPTSPPTLPFIGTTSSIVSHIQSQPSKKSLTSVPPPPPVPVPIPPPIPERKSKQSKKGSRGSSKQDKQLPTDLELTLSKSAKTPPLPTSSKSSSKKRESTSLNVPNPNFLLAGSALPELLGQAMGLPSVLRHEVQASTPSTGSSNSQKKRSGGNNALNQPLLGKSPPVSLSSRSPSSSQQTPPPVAQNLSATLPIDIDRVPNPALFQGNPAIRAFHPMWVRNPGPPPPGYSTAGSPVPPAMGKPPPLNSSPFSGQQVPPSRPGYPSPPPLRIPNPNTSPLQAFQHFKRDSPIGGPLYRLPSGQPQPGVPLSNILPGMMSPHSAGAERFFGAPGAYGHPYGLLPPHAQGQHPQPLFNSPYDYRPPEATFKEDPGPPRTTSSGSLPTPVSSASSSPPPTTSASVPSMSKDEVSASRDSEFGGLVSYFSSQRSEEDMDT